MKKFQIRTTFFLLLFIFVFCIGCEQRAQQNQYKHIIELTGSTTNLDSIRLLAKLCGASDIQLYQWKNYVVLYSHFNQIEDFSKQLAKQFPNLQVKIYEKPFYSFSKAERCDDTKTAPEWEHILLTANLVEEEELQREYLEYHKTQFKDWPEVSQGFCNAEFQQLLLYKKGRQLMLVISIPAGKKLDELNPKTVENNPRMDKWNQLMNKYQEGIEGTAPGEKWVFLNKVE